MNNFIFKKIPPPNGFSLIEILVAISILTLVITIGSDFIITGFRATTFNSEQDTAVQQARRAMEIITKEIRGANSSELGDYPLSLTEANDFIFYSDTDDDGQTEKIRYFLNGIVIMCVITEPDAANSYNHAGATSTVATYLNNGAMPIFTYYDNDYNQTSIINNIRLINIKLQVNVTPARAPNDYYLESDVNLRNLKDNL
jgi:prepilin-type N-terminal cleavage/methylation domain-containing protein